MARSAAEVRSRPARPSWLERRSASAASTSPRPVDARTNGARAYPLDVVALALTARLRRGHAVRQGAARAADSADRPRHVPRRRRAHRIVRSTVSAPCSASPADCSSTGSEQANDLAGGVMMALASLAGGFARSGTLLLSARVVEGFGFATLTVAAPKVIVAATGAEVRRFALGAWGTYMPIGMALSLLMATALLGPWAGAASGSFMRGSFCSTWPPSAGGRRHGVGRRRREAAPLLTSRALAQRWPGRVPGCSACASCCSRSSGSPSWRGCPPS